MGTTTTKTVVITTTTMVVVMGDINYGVLPSLPPYLACQSFPPLPPVENVSQ